MKDKYLQVYEHVKVVSKVSKKLSEVLINLLQSTLLRVKSLKNESFFVPLLEMSNFTFPKSEMFIFGGK